jgi:hypothetical protein
MQHVKFPSVPGTHMQITGHVCVMNIRVANISRPTHKLDYYPSDILGDLGKGPH